MRNIFQVLSRAIVGGGVAVSCLFAVAWGDEGPLPRSAEQLRQPTLRSHLPRERIDVLVARWTTRIDSSDVVGSIAAIELLGGAPKPFVEAAVARLQQSGALEKVFAAANEQEKSELRNSAVIVDYVISSGETIVSCCRPPFATGGKSKSWLC